MSVSASPSEGVSPPPPRRWRGRWLRGFGTALLLAVMLPLLALGAALLWANTESGRGAITRLAMATVPGLVLEGLEGPLPGRLGLARLAMADAEGVWLEVEQARLTWDVRRLLTGTLRIEQISAARLALHRLPNPEAAPPPADAPPEPLLPELPHAPLPVLLDRLSIGEVALGAPLLGEALALRVEGRGRLDPWGVTLGLEAATLEGGSSLAIEASLRPGAGRLGASIALHDRAGGPLARLIGLPDRAPRLDLALEGPPEGAAFTLLADAGAGLSAKLAGTLRAPDLTRLSAEFTGRIEAGAVLPAPFDTPFEVEVEATRMPDGVLDLPRLRLTGAAGEVVARGLVGRDQQAAITITATLPDSTILAPLLPAEAAGWSSLAANARITGSTAAPRIALTVAPEGFRSPIAPLAALLGPAPRLTLRAAAPDRIEALNLTAAALRLDLAGQAGAALDLAFTADLAAEDGVVPGVAGALRLAGSARGPRDNPHLALTAESARLEGFAQVLQDFRLALDLAEPRTAPRLEASAQGRFQGLPLSLQVTGAPEEEGWLRLAAARAGFGPARLEAAGRLHPARQLFDGTLTLEAPDLAPFAPLLGQPIEGALRLQARLAPQGTTQHGEAVLEVPRLLAAGTAARGLRASAAGHPGALDVTLTGRIEEVETEFRGKLSAAPQGAQVLEIATLRATGFGESLRLAAPARISRAADGGITLAPLSLALGRGATLRAEGKFGPERADLRLTLPPFPVAGLASLMPEVNPSGSLGAEIRVTGPVGAPEVAATLRGSQLRGGPRNLPPAELRAEARRAGDGAISGRADLTMGAAARLAATLRLPRGPDGPAEGSLDGNAELAALTGPLLAAGADRVAGRLALALRLSGSLRDPTFGGEARLSGGAWRNALYGVAITEAAGTLRAEGPRLRADLTARSATGRLTLAGTVAPLAPGLPVELQFTAQDASLISLDMLRETLDADLRLAGGLGSGATLSGLVRLRRAEIRIPDRLPASVRSLDPVIERGRPPGAPPQPPRVAARPAAHGGGPPITLAVQLEAPRNVFVRGRGLDAELGGTLAVAGPIAAPEITGELALRRGDVQVLARRLAFDRGRLLFDGALLPSLDFRATSQTGGTTVAVEVTGTPSAPVIAFSSTPELPQDEVLARLLFDRPTGELSPFEIAQIAQALAGSAGLPVLPGGGTAGIVERLRRTLTLDRLSVGGQSETAVAGTKAEERRGATLEAGRYIAEGVYVGVRQGTDTGSSRVGLRVELGPRLRLEAETGDREAGERVGVSWEWQWGR
jgi:translocation and assembly module TamB